MLLIDAGDFSSLPGTKAREMRDRYFFTGMKLLGYDAAGIGESEMRNGLERLSATAKRYGLPLVNSNIIDRRSKKPAITPSIVRRVGGTRTLFGRKGAVRVGIFSVSLPGYIYASGTEVPKRYYVVDPRLSALEATTNLRSQGCNLIIAVSHQGWPKSLELAREVPGIDIVLNGHRSHKSTRAQREGSTLVVDTGENERSFTEVSVTFTGDSLAATAADVCGTALGSPGDPRFLSLEKKYTKEARRPSPRTKKT